MVEILIGGTAVAFFLLVVQWARAQELRVAWWQWALTVLAVVYAVFVAEVVVEFLREGAAKAALVMGTMMGFVAIAWAVLLKRIVFAGKEGATP